MLVLFEQSREWDGRTGSVMGLVASHRSDDGWVPSGPHRAVVFSICSIDCWRNLGMGERITVQELIRSRVYQEVCDYNASGANRFCGLAFRGNGVIIIVDDRSITDPGITRQLQIESPLLPAP
jgi:hypothetical protein